jgi:hypothetical protein
MPTAITIMYFTIVANDIDSSSHIRRDWLQGNTHGDRRPRRRHLFRSFRRLFADRTTGVVRGQFLEAVPVNGVSTRHFMRCIATAEQILLADRTVAHVLAVLAIVIVKQQGINAHTTVVTVLEVFATTHAAEPTILAMIRSFIGGHPEIADIAVHADVEYSCSCEKKKMVQNETTFRIG